MRSKILLILLILVLGTVGTANASSFYYFDTYPQGCASCGGSYLTVAPAPAPQVTWVPKTSDVDEDSDTDEENNEVEEDEETEEETEEGTEEGTWEYVEEPLSISSPTGRSYIVSSTVSGSLFTELADTLGNVSLYTITYEPNKIKLYYEEEVDEVVGKAIVRKYKIVPVASDSGNITYNSNGSHTFFICKDCGECDNSECSSLVASNGFSIPPKAGYEKDTEKLMLSNYCISHACSFFWSINNGDYNISTVEGIDCKAEAQKGSSFCEKHTCKAVNCNAPIIGCNIMDGRTSEVAIYQGSDEEQYSDYCVDHFCKHYKCKERRRSVNSSSAEYSSTEGRYINFPGYCTEHGNNCTIYNCNNPVTKMHYDEENKMTVYICEYHTEHYEEIKDLDVEGQPINLDDTWNNIIPEAYITREECSNCHKYMQRRVENWDIEYGGEVNGKWYCSVCFAQIIYGKTEVKDYTGNGFNYNYPEPPPTVDPSTCEHNLYPVPNSVRFIDITNETHTQVWVCTNCRTEQRETYNHIYLNGVCACKHKQDGSEEMPLVTIENAEYVIGYSRQPKAYEGLMEKDILLVQLKDSDSIHLKVSNNDLSTLVYKWNDKLEGHSWDTTGTIPDKVVLKIPADRPALESYEMEKPDYILTVEYRTKAEDRVTMIKYQIYLP